MKLIVYFLTMGLAFAAPQKKPNILFILTDDQGWPTLGSYGNEKVPTPHLDKLAEEGMRFTDAYVMPQCTATRAALLSGQHTARNGMWHVISWYGYPWAAVSEPVFTEQFPADAFSIPKGLKHAGYSTGMAGKWHLTDSELGNYILLRPHAASKFGFDYVAPVGEGSLREREGDKWVDHLTDEAIDFIGKQGDEPWFFYLSHHTIHRVITAPDELVEKHLAAGAPEEGMFNANYLAAIEHLDNSIGRLMGFLDAEGLRDNTIVVFLSDNGGVDRIYNLPGWDGEPTDSGEPLTVNEEHFDNAPLRAGKGSPYEGGIRVPCIVRWPGVTEPGSVSSTPIHVIDWLPTLLDAAGTKEPEDIAVDGLSLMPLFKGNDLPGRPLFWHMPLYDLRWAATPCTAMREGDWKLIEYYGDRFDAETLYRPGHHLELYNLAEDPGEERNLAASNSERANAMSEKIHSWLAAMNTPVPGANPHFDRSRMFEETREKQPWNK